MEQFENLSKEQLITDLMELRQRVLELEQMDDEKKHFQEELIRTRAMFVGLFEFAPDAIVVVDREGRIVQVNKQFENLFGYTREEIVGATHDILVPERLREKHSENRRGYMSAPHIRQMGAGLELYGTRKDGSEFPVDIALGPLQTKDDIVVLAVVRDFTERKQREAEIQALNELLERKIEDLAAANKELEAFGYTVSHDLQAPLRVISGFSQILLESGLKLNEEEMRYLETIHNKAQKMNRLIKDLLSFSRMGRQSISASDIDMEKLAASVFDELKAAVPERKINFVMGPTPSVRGDDAMIRQVLMNLISNAVKFTANREEAIIEVGSRSEGNNIIYYVKDNGAGFDMKHADRLFGVFQRLHGADEFEGSGVGLALVERIISRHGGRVCAEGEVGKGSTFYFELKRGPENETPQAGEA